MQNKYIFIVDIKQAIFENPLYFVDVDAWDQEDVEVAAVGVVHGSGLVNLRKFIGY
jgi:hypothetical protein